MLLPLFGLRQVANQAQRVHGEPDQLYMVWQRVGSVAIAGAGRYAQRQVNVREAHLHTRIQGQAFAAQRLGV